MALPLLLLFQLQNSLHLCMSVQYWLVLPSDVPSLWSLQLPMLGYTSAFSVFWMLVLGLLGKFWIQHLTKKTLAYQHILISIVGMILLYWLASWATQYLWWNIYGVYNEVSRMSYSTQIASMLLALLVLVVFRVLFTSKPTVVALLKKISDEYMESNLDDEDYAFWLEQKALRANG